MWEDKETEAGVCKSCFCPSQYSVSTACPLERFGCDQEPWLTLPTQHALLHAQKHGLVAELFFGPWAVLVQKEREYEGVAKL